MLAKLTAALAALCLLDGTASAQDGATLTDPQIGHVAYTAGLIDIDAAKQALSKSENQTVRAFAEDMVRDHTAVNDQALDLLNKLHVAPEDNDTSRTLTDQATARQADLDKLDGADFDRAYLENEVAYHKAVNSALESTLIPSTSNAELKSLLQTGLKLFQGHQQHAEALVSKLN